MFKFIDGLRCNQIRKKHPSRSDKSCVQQILGPMWAPSSFRSLRTFLSVLLLCKLALLKSEVFARDWKPGASINFQPDPEKLTKANDLQKNVRTATFATAWLALLKFSKYFVIDFCASSDWCVLPLFQVKVFFLTSLIRKTKFAKIYKCCWWPRNPWSISSLDRLNRFNRFNRLVQRLVPPLH